MDKEKILLAAKTCCGGMECGVCPLLNEFGNPCRDFFAKFIVDNFAVTVLDPLLTRWDAEKPPEKIDRAYILDTAKKMVTGKREQDYGSPEDNFNVIGKYWSIYKGIDFSAEDVAIMMGMLKVARIQTGTATIDSWIDLAGYAACGGEIACKQKVIEVEV